LTVTDIRIQQAKEHHEVAAALKDHGRRRRELRDQIIRRLREEDPKQWTFGRLAREIGCSKELIVYICGQATEQDRSGDAG
jgi:AraC-like DNA-binding protein